MQTSKLQHQSLMNQIYGKQRYIYDATRKFYLLGRDQLIHEMRPPNRGNVLEIGCGTGRNLIYATKTRSRAKYYGIDISDEMLSSANKLIKRHKMCEKIQIAQADATHFEPEHLFGVQKFDRIFLSYTLSMIPNWKCAIDEALEHLSESGSLHIVDFGMQSDLPIWFRKPFMKWLNIFHVTPLSEVTNYLGLKTRQSNRSLVSKSLFRGYTRYYVIGPKRGG